MKQLVLLLTSLFVLTAVLCGCTQQQEKNQSYVSAAELSQEETDILKLVGAQEPILFDFTTFLGKSFSIQTMELENGSWSDPRTYSSSLDEDTFPFHGRIAIKQDEETGAILSLAVQGPHGFTHSSPTPDESAPTYSSHSTALLSSRVEIEPDKPIALQVYYGYANGQASHTSYIPDYALEHPEEIDSDYAQIVIITFSETPLS